MTLLTEKAIRMDADGRPLTVIENPSIQVLLALLDRSPDDQVKGLIIGSELYFWSATADATHGHVAEKLWPTDGKRTYWEYPEYTEGRLIIELDDGHPTIQFDPEMLDNPRILALLKSDRLYFRFPGAGFMNYSEYVANEQENQKRRLARAGMLESMAHSRVHHNPSIPAIKALTKSSEYQSMRFVVYKDGDMEMGDAGKFSHRDIAPAVGQWATYGYIQHNDDGFFYVAYAPYSMHPTDHPSLRRLESGGIPRGNRSWMKSQDEDSV